MKALLICLFAICVAAASSFLAQSFANYGAALIDRAAHGPGGE